MAKGGSSGEHVPRQGTWIERKPRIRKAAGMAPTMTWRRRTPRHTPRKKIFDPMSSENVESSPRGAVVSKADDPLMCMASSTSYSTDTFERDEEQIIKDFDKPKTPRKIMNNRTGAALESSAPGVNAASFVFQKRLARIDWRAVHAIDVDRLIREVDIDTLETVLDTIAFGDVRGEDTRNFTEANFVKLFRLAQLMVEYLLHVQELLADHKAELLQAGAIIQQKSEKIRSRFLWQRNTLLQTRHELKQAKKTLKTYEVMMKIQGKTQASQSNQPQVRHCPFCEKVFESSYYLDLHVARRHQKTQEVTEDKILAVVSKAEEAAAARVKAETSLALQAEIQQLRERYQADLQRAETVSNTQVRSLQADLKQSDNQLHEVQTRLEILQAQILSAAPNISQNSRLGSLYAVEKLKEKDNGPDQERLYDLESKFTGLEHQVKTLGQENSRLLKELNVAYAEVSDLQSAKRQSVFALETRVEDLRKENQHLKRTMSKVNNMAVTTEVTSHKPDVPNLEAHDQYPENTTMSPSWICNSRTNSQTPPAIPRPDSVEVPVESLEAQDETNDNLPILTCHNISELILPKIEAEEPTNQDSDTLDLHNLEKSFDLGEVEPLDIVNTCTIDQGLSPVHQSQNTGEPDVSKPLKKIQFSESVTLTNMVEEEPIALSLFKERRGQSPSERWRREHDQDQALLALARPASRRQRTEAVSIDYNEEASDQESSPEPEHYRHSTPPFKRAPSLITKEAKNETSLERMRPSSMQRPKSAAAVKSKSRGDESPTTVEEMRAKLEREMAAAHAEQKRRQKSVQRLLAKELVKEKLDEKKKWKRTKSADGRSHKPGTQDHKSDTPSESEDEVEKRTTPHEDEKAHRIQEIAEVAAMDVGEEAPTIPIPEKEKWLSEHPFVPIPTLPHVVAKYPHPEAAFEKAHKVVENEFDGQLREELKKFGIASSTNGISDATYNSISTALEKQRSLRMSQIHGNERKLVEYERGAIVWHTQRAVHDRDIDIIESQFDVSSDLGTEQLSDAHASDDSGDESGKTNYKSSRSHQSHKSEDSDSESKEDCNKEDESKPEGASHMKSSEQSSPTSSEIAGSSDDLQETDVVQKAEVVINRAKHSSSSKVGLRSPPDKRVQYVSRAFSWKQKQEPTTQSNRDFPSREPGRPNVQIFGHARQSEQGEEVEDELGLGDWNSDEGAVPSRGKQRRVQIDDRQPVSVSQDSPIRDLSPPKDLELLDLQQLKSSMTSTSHKPTPPPSSPKSSTATVSAENTCRVNFQKPMPDKPAPLEEHETLGNEGSLPNNKGGSVDSDETEGSDGSDVEENKIFKELTSEIDEIISLY